MTLTKETDGAAYAPANGAHFKVAQKGGILVIVDKVAVADQDLDLSDLGFTKQRAHEILRNLEKVRLARPYFEGHSKGGDHLGDGNFEQNQQLMLFVDLERDQQVPLVVELEVFGEFDRVLLLKIGIKQTTWVRSRLADLATRIALTLEAMPKWWCSLSSFEVSLMFFI